MILHQRDIVETEFFFARSIKVPHFAIVVSNNELIENEGIVYLVLITSKDYNNEYCYALTNEMTTFTFSKQSFVKCHIIVSDLQSNVFRRVGQMKQPYFNEMVDKIISSIF